MLDPKTCTIKEAVRFAQDVKNSYGKKPETKSIEVDKDSSIFLIEFLKICHPLGEKIKEGATLRIGKKPEYHRQGNSNTAYYVSLEKDALFQPVWFSDCRKRLRNQRIKEEK